MKGKRIVLTILTLMLMGTNSFVYANETTSPPPIQMEAPEAGIAELYHKAGLDSPEVILNTLANLGITKEELKGYMGQDKKIYDILKEKEITQANFKKALTKEYRCRIKEAVKTKVITKKEGKALTKLLNERMKMWEV